MGRGPQPHRSIVDRTIAARIGPALTILLAGCVTTPRAANAADVPAAANPAWSTTDARANDALDPAIPTPESVIGHPIGQGAVRYEPMVHYFHALADASPLVTLQPSGRTHEGRTLYYLTITSEANHARLDEIKSLNGKLADPRHLTETDDPDRIIETLPGIAWMAYSIHGDELSGCDAAVQLAYQLAAGTDESTRRLRDDLVIHVDPLQNPDGRERYLGQLQHLTGKVQNPDYQAMQHYGLWSAGRGNHYLFDLNRDWLVQSQPETHGRAAKIIEWNPHLVVDGHEMGSLDTYLFDPPREPHNVNISQSNLDWRRRFSADQAAAFDQRGWSYYTQEWYEEWYPGYTNAWAALQGAIGILYEQAAVNAAAIKQPAGNILTYRQAVHQQLVSSFTNLESLRAHRKEFMRDFFNDHQWAVSPERSGTEVYLLPPPEDAALFDQFITLLHHHGIETEIAKRAVSARNAIDIWGNTTTARVFPAGTLIVKAAQPHRRLLRAVLEFDPRMTDTFLQDERRDLESHRGTRAYDVSSWNATMAYGLEGYWADAANIAETGDYEPPQPPALPEPPDYGYLIPGASLDTYKAAVRLLEKDAKVRVATEVFTIDDTDYPRGTILLHNRENPDNLPDILTEAVADLHVEVHSADTALADAGPDLGGPRYRLLTPPRIAIATQWPLSTTSFGATWFLLDARIGLRASPVNIQRLSRIDLRKYNVLVIPGVWGSSALEAVLDKPAREKLKKWMEAGGTLIALGGSAAFLADENRGLSQVRLRRDVLDKLEIYHEAAERERRARTVEVTADDVWGPRTTTTLRPSTRRRSATPTDDSTSPPPSRNDPRATTSTNTTDTSGQPDGARKDGPSDLEDQKRRDQWLRIFSPRGAFLAADFKPDHWLTFGLTPHVTEDRLPVFVAGSHVLMARHPVETPVRLLGKDDLRLSGLLWPEAAERLEHGAYCTVERVGHGQLILFATDPYFRAHLEGTGRLFRNALLFGPGLGTSQPVPW